MGKGYKHGGANPLNFDVKTYPSEVEMKSDKPRENTIVVITTTTMTSWAFYETEPKEPKVGMVWISVGDSVGVEFNALRQNALQVYPCVAKQYEGGVFVEKPAYIYQDSKWVKFWDGCLFDNGEQYKSITGGWEQNANVNIGGYANTGEVKFETELYTNAVSGSSAIVTTKNKINLTGYNTLYFQASAGYDGAGFVHTATSGNIAADSLAFVDLLNPGKYSLDVKAINEPVYISMGSSHGRTQSCSKIWLE